MTASSEDIVGILSKYTSNAIKQPNDKPISPQDQFDVLGGGLRVAPCFFFFCVLTTMTNILSYISSGDETPNNAKPFLIT